MRSPRRIDYGLERRTWIMHFTLHLYSPKPSPSISLRSALPPPNCTHQSYPPAAPRQTPHPPRAAVPALSART